MPPRRSCSQSAVLALSLLALLAASSGCGSGTASALSGGGGGGGTNVPPAMAGFRVVDPLTQGPPRTSPAEIRFVLSDAEGNPAQVEFLYRVPGFAAEHLAHVSALPSNPASLAASATGTVYALSWDFAGEDLLPDDASYTAGVLVYARVQGSNVILAGANSAQLGLGNDAPVVEVDTPSAEVDGVVPVRLHLSDSSSDPLDVRIEFDVQGDAPDAGWLIARPGGLLTETPTPLLAFEDLTVGPGGVDVVFFWDTDVDLSDLERDVRMRVTPIDPAVQGLAELTPIFRVDNNAAPTAAIHEGTLLTASEHQRGIPIPYTVRDPEGDVVRTVFQWRRPDESFPLLPDDTAAVEAILADPAQRALHRVCTEHPAWIEGETLPVDHDTVRLPELATTGAVLLHGGLVGTEIQLLRLPARWASLMQTEWGPGAVLDQAVDALAVDDGREALVLEGSAEYWRLRRIEIASGATTRDYGTWALGQAVAQDWEVGGRAVLVLSVQGSKWILTRVDLFDGKLDSIASGTAPGPVRDVAVEGSRLALITAGSSLLRVDWSSAGVPRVLTLLDDLYDPRGIVIDRLRPGSAYVAERAAPTPEGTGRVLVIDTRTLERRTLAVGSVLDGGAPFPEPQALAFERGGASLLVSTRDPASGQFQIRGFDFEAYSSREVRVLAEGIPNPITSIACGREGLRLACMPGANDFLVSGGVQQARTITSFDLHAQTVEVDTSFAPHPRIQPWRISQTSGVLRASPEGKFAVFAWDATDAPEAQVLLQALPFDAEQGGGSETGALLQVPELERGGTASVAGSTIDPYLILDADADGLMDILGYADGSGFMDILFQACGGEFTRVELSLDPDIVMTTVDYDGNGLVDVLSLSHDPAEAGYDLRALRQVQPRVFQWELLVPGLILDHLPSTQAFVQPTDLGAGDIDGDGDLDIGIGANAGGVGRTIVCLRIGPRQFGAPVELEDGPNDSFGLSTRDFDGDARAELVRIVDQGVRICRLVNGALESEDLYTPVGNPPVIVDVDGDGRCDALSSWGDVAIAFQRGDGTFPERLDLVVTRLGSLALPVEAIDVDQDGDLDLVWWNADGWAVKRQVSFRVFEAHGSTHRWPSLAGFVPKQIVDLDHDGRLDTVFVGAGGIRLGLARSPFHGLLPGTLGSLGPVLAVLDAEPDGDLDTLVPFNGGARVMRQSPLIEPQPGPTASLPPNLPGLLRSTALGDLDGDGDVDLALAVGTTGSFPFAPGGIALFRREGAEFQPLGAPLAGLPNLQVPFECVLADVDGDARLDVCAAYYTSNNVAVFLQGTDGSFAATPQFVGIDPNQVGCRAIATADLDEDGNLDLVTANYFSRNLSIYSQVGPGAFSPTPTLLGNGTGLGTPMDVFAHDLDGDGDVDIACSNLAGQGLAIFWQEGQGNFSAPTFAGAVMPNFGAQSITGADLDHDGRFELLVTGQGVGVFRATGWRTYERLTCPVYAVGGGLRVDFDLDGDADWIQGGSIYWGGR